MLDNIFEDPEKFKIFDFEFFSGHFSFLILNMWPIIGHEKIIDLLQRQISEESFSSSYLFLGEKSLGKRKTALFFAKTLLCKKRGKKFFPCLSCPSCLKFSKNLHPDFLKIEKENDKKNISINQIRNLKSFFSSKPFYSQCKIAIINQADLLTIEAQNSLLKVLEETPGKGIIILLSEKKENFLLTILSRCQILHFFPIKKEMLKKEMLKLEGTESLVDEVLDYSQGRPGLAIELLEKPEILEKNKKTIKEFSEIFQKPLYQKFNYIEEKAKKDKDEVLKEIDLWILFFQKLLLKKVNSSFSSEKDYLSSLKKISDLAERSHELKKDLKDEVNLKLALENFVI